MIVAGHAGRLQTGRHTRTTGTIGDLYLAAADKAMGAGLSSFPTASREINGIFA